MGLVWLIQTLLLYGGVAVLMGMWLFAMFVFPYLGLKWALRRLWDRMGRL